MNGIGFWMKNARQVSLPQSMLPVLLAVGMSLRHDGFSLWLALVAAFGVGCAHLGMNLADDYFDYREGSAEKRTRLASDGIRARVAKYPYLSSGAASVRELVVAVCVFLGLAAGAGAVVVACRGVVPLALAGIGAVLGISYSGGPLRLGYRGLGEPVVGLLFGPLLMAGVQYAACGVLDAPVLLVGVAVGLLVTNILYTHSVLDRHADSRMGKRTLAHLLGTPRAMIAASGLFCFAPFVLVAAGSIPRRPLRRSCSCPWPRSCGVRCAAMFSIVPSLCARPRGWAPWAISRDTATWGSAGSCCGGCWRGTSSRSSRSSCSSFIPYSK